MSDEEESVTDEFSASEDEWEPAKFAKGVASSEEEDSDYELPSKAAVPEKKTAASSKSAAARKPVAANSRKRKVAPYKDSPKITAAKKSKPGGQSLRMKLYKRYNPPPKTSPVIGRGGSLSNSPSSSTSKKQCKDRRENSKEEHRRRTFGFESSDEDASSTSDFDCVEDLSDPSYFELRTDSVNNVTSVSQPAPRTDYNFQAFFANIQYLERVGKAPGEELESKKTGVAGAGTWAESLSSTSPLQPSDKKRNDLADISALLALGEELDVPGRVENKLDGGIEKKHDKKLKCKESAEDGLKRQSKRSKSKKKGYPTTHSEDSEWEEVSDGNEDVVEAEEPASGTLQIHVKLPSRQNERMLKRKEQMDQELKRKFNNDVRSHQAVVHKVSLMCRFARSYRCNQMLNNSTLMQTALKLLPSKNSYPSKDGTQLKYYKALLEWFRETVTLDDKQFYVKDRKICWKRFPRQLAEQILARKAACKQDYVFIFVVLLRAMGLQCRLLVNMQPLPLKPDRSLLLPINAKPREEPKEEPEQKKKKTASKSKSTTDCGKSSEQREGNKKEPATRQSSRRTTKKIGGDEQPESSAKIAPSEPKSSKDFSSDMWAEVWCDVEDQWAYVDIFKGKVESVETLLKATTVHATYVFAFQNNLGFKDITDRYCPTWSSSVRSCRLDNSWLEKTFSRYKGNRTILDCKEELELRQLQEKMPLPTSINECKNHPLYALRRHLLKFEAIYPPTAPSLGFIRGEPIYARACVHTLHSRDIWLKQARVVKLGEQPYKVVKSRPKWDRFTGTVIKDQPLEIFGYWQTTDYEPPTAENGIVPRNAYGNVELFQPQMLPKKTVHLRLSGLNRICRKLGIDCANAVVGFDFHQGACHPAFDGFVVCEEFADLVTDAWHEDQEAQEQKQEEKYLARVYGNWKKLVRGLLIRENLKRKYKF